jgi:hypothetical protein
MLDLFPSNLRQLDLSFNTLEGIGENAFQTLTSLTDLVLQVIIWIVIACSSRQ